MRRPGSHEQVLAAFQAGEVHILLGTQMIAKGLDFPNVTLVGVVNADVGAAPARLPRRRADVPARRPGGRPDRPRRPAGPGAGADLLPRAPGDRATRRSTTTRASSPASCPSAQQLGVPPFGRLVRLIARGPDESAVREYLRSSPTAACVRPPTPRCRVLGPAPAPIIKIRNLYRFHLQARVPTAPAAAGADARPPGDACRRPQGIELAMDVDPISML